MKMKTASQPIPRFVSHKGTAQGQGTIADPTLTMPTLDREHEEVYLQQGHNLGKVVVPSHVKGLFLMPYVPRVTEGRLHLHSRLKEAADPKPVVAGLKSEANTVAFNMRFGANVDLTVVGVDEEHPGKAVLAYCDIDGDLDLRGCKHTTVVVRHCDITGDIMISDTQDGRVHLQDTRCNDVVVDDDTTTELICGSADTDPKSKHYGKPVDCCEYRSIRHVKAKAIPAPFIEKKKEYGTGKKTGNIVTPKFAKSKSIGSVALEG